MWMRRVESGSAPWERDALLNGRCLPCCSSRQVGEQMKRMPGGSGNNPFAQLIEDAEGLDKIEALQVCIGVVSRAEVVAGSVGLFQGRSSQCTLEKQPGVSLVGAGGQSWAMRQQRDRLVAQFELGGRCSCTAVERCGVVRR